MSSNSRWGRKKGILVLLIIVLSSMTMRSQGYSLDQIKAEALINLAGFIQWPPGIILPSPAPITLCLLGRSGTGDELQRSAQREERAGHPIAVHIMQSPTDIAGCHLVFISASAAKDQQKLIASAKGSPIVLVSEIAGFVDKGGSISLGLQNSRITLEINVDAAEQAHLKINPRLLAEAHVVHPGNHKREQK